MYCIKCGKYIEDKYLYCPNCGAAKYKKQQSQNKLLCKALYYVFMVELIISIVAYTINFIVLSLENASTIEIIFTTIEMIPTVVIGVVAVIVFKKLSEKE